MSMKARLRLAAIGALGAPLLAAAQTPTPTPEHERLHVFVGAWALKGRQNASPLGPEGPFEATETCRLFDGGFHVVCELRGTAAGAPYREQSTMGYDADAKAFTWFDIDNLGMNAMALGHLEGDTWTFVWNVNVEGKPARFRFRGTRKSSTVQQSVYDLSIDRGPWTVVSTVVATKVGGAR